MRIGTLAQKPTVRVDAYENQKLNILTTSEIRGSIATGGELASLGSLPDPRDWCDLVAEKEAAVEVVRRRIVDQRTPLVAQVVRWPKETGDWRPMVWLDPLDQVVFRGVVGRLVPGIQRRLNKDVVLSSLLEESPPRWRLMHWGAQTAERRRKGLELLTQRPVLGLIDIKRFYPSVTLETLDRVLGKFPVDSKSLDFILAWLRQLDVTYGAPGLPTGHDPSRMLADGLLVGCDNTLESLGVPFLRYVDDTWFFIRDVAEFDPVVTQYRQSLASIDLEIQPGKTKPLVGLEAMNEVQNFAIAYLGAELTSRGPEGLAASLELFEYAVHDLPARTLELRRSIRALQQHLNLAPLELLRSNLDLLRYAPDHWTRYLRTLATRKDMRRKMDEDWMIEQVERHWEQKMEVYKSIVFLRAMANVKLTPERGQAIGNLISSPEGWLSPVRVWSAHVWGASDAYSPDQAVELLEASGDYSTKRGLALTFDSRRDHNKKRVWFDRMRRVDPELEPTVRWLEN